MISVIVRTKNEERWMRPCLEGIMRQKVDMPVEVVLVDNNSTDQTVARAQSICPSLKLVTIDQFLPGLALNMGIRASSGDYLVCVSAHCPPVDEYWLANLLRNLDQNDVAGVYGRQVPTRFTNPFDKRDLLNMFGLDRRVQIRDTFFHNANSMMPRAVWEQFPFDEAITNIEDRLWGQRVIDAGLKIVYEPEAAVFHHHGIHQDNRPDRAHNVVRILEAHVEDFRPDRYGNPFDANQHEVCAIIPLRGHQGDIGFERQLLELTIKSLQDSQYVDRMMVATDDAQITDLARELGAEVPFLRPTELSAPDKRVDDVLQHYLSALEADDYFPDVVLPIEVTFPFRPSGLIDGVIERLLEGGFDTVVAGIPEHRACWQHRDGDFVEVTDTSKPRHEREPLHISVPGLACACWPHVLRNGSRLGGKVGIFETRDPLAGTEAHTGEEFASIQSRMRLSASAED
jgi:GT2 family glycosyltransferase